MDDLALESLLNKHIREAKELGIENGYYQQQKDKIFPPENLPVEPKEHE